MPGAKAGAMPPNAGAMPGDSQRDAGSKSRGNAGGNAQQINADGNKKPPDPQRGRAALSSCRY
jgi:hypothetical protein